MKIERIIENMKELPGFDEEFLRTIYIDKFKFRKIIKAIPEFYTAYLKKSIEYNTFFDFFETFHCYLIGLGIKIKLCKEYFDMVSSRMNEKISNLNSNMAVSS